jgi:uncharacterized protein (DUF952 family)
MGESSSAAEERAHYLHLVPVDVWRRQADRQSYLPEGYEADGFIHLTIGDAALVEVANRYCRDDPREFVVLSIDPALVTALIRIEDPERIYPHVHGPLDCAAVVTVRDVLRREDGSFVAIEDQSSRDR